METKSVIVVPYNEMRFYYITSHYDLHWSGACIYNGKIAEFITRDLTDYEAMEAKCPCCVPGGTANYKDCICEVYVDLICEITELPWIERFKWFWKRLYWKHKYHPRYAY